MIAQRRVDAISHSQQPLLEIEREISRPVLEPALLPLPPSPVANRHLPQGQAVEGVTGHEEPAVRQRVVPGQAGRRLVVEVEDPPLGGHHRVDAGIGVVVPQPERFGDPLVVPRRADNPVVRHRIAVGRVQVLRPFVDLCRPRLDGLRPLPVLPDVRDPQRRPRARLLSPRRHVCRSSLITSKLTRFSA